MSEAASSNSGFVNVNGRAMAVPVWDLVELAQHIQMVCFIWLWEVLKMDAKVSC